jgi:hypothetical protein
MKMRKWDIMVRSNQTSFAQQCTQSPYDLSHSTLYTIDGEQGVSTAMTNANNGDNTRSGQSTSNSVIDVNSFLPQTKKPNTA